MTRGRARRYLLTKQGYYPGVVAAMNYSVWDWSTLNTGTLFQDSTKTLRVDRDAFGNYADPNGKPVGAWVDGVQGIDAIQATTANKPTYVTGSLGGLPTLSLDGGDWLGTSTDLIIGTFAVWAVFKNTATDFRIPYEHSVNVGANDGMAMLTSNGGAITARRGSVTSSKDLSLNWGNDGIWRVTRHEHNGTQATHKLAINDVLQTLSNVSNNDIGTSTATQPLYIGGRFNAGRPLIGNIAHLCIVSPYPTAAIIASMESYINGIWSVY